MIKHMPYIVKGGAALLIIAVCLYIYKQQRRSEYDRLQRLIEIQSYAEAHEMLAINELAQKGKTGEILKITGFHLEQYKKLVAKFEAAAGKKSFFRNEEALNWTPPPKSSIPNADESKL